jgi:hypothetical protein
MFLPKLLPKFPSVRKEFPVIVTHPLSDQGLASRDQREAIFSPQRAGLEQLVGLDRPEKVINPSQANG